MRAAKAWHLTTRLHQLIVLVSLIHLTTLVPPRHSDNPVWGIGGPSCCHIWGLLLMRS
ncbi:hypothetical protein BS78_K166100 [Paspalum vaginatum]|uniref:Secreted protein n=1 Tax=Paspalum vaginatum TaxID=158149 RepID=A0A9W8CDW7_9POAL|nr:hypothetical protein BS78_K166100 [Paspalum vaginatum]